MEYSQYYTDEHGNIIRDENGRPILAKNAGPYVCALYRQKAPRKEGSVIIGANWRRKILDPNNGIQIFQDPKTKNWYNVDGLKVDISGNIIKEIIDDNKEKERKVEDKDPYEDDDYDPDNERGLWRPS